MIGGNEAHAYARGPKGPEPHCHLNSGGGKPNQL